MSTLVEFHDGTTASLRDSDQLSNREVKKLQRSMRIAATAAVKMQEAGYKEGDPESWAAALTSLTDDELDSIDLYQRAAVITRLQSWTRTDDAGNAIPIPADADAVDDLPRPIFDKLTAVAADISLSDKFDKDSGLTDPKVDSAN